MTAARTYIAALAAIAFGITLGLAVVVAGVVRQSGRQEAQPRTTNPAHRQQPAATAQIAIVARHRGNLKLDLRARVTLGGQPLNQGRVVAWTDMQQMPLAHRQGPIPMTEMPGEAGLYRARTTVPMVGDYTVEVRAMSPVKGMQRATVHVGDTQLRGVP